MPHASFSAPDRRAFLAAAVASLGLGGAGGAQPLPGVGFQAPVVDSLTLQVIVDNAVFGPFLPNLDRPGLKVLRGAPGGGGRMSRRTLMAEFGRRVLVDFGYTPEALANNLALLGVDPRSVDAAVLSHGHLDHYGGFSGLFGGRAAGPRRVPLLVGGEETFCERVTLTGPDPAVMGTLDRTALAAAGYDVQIAARPRVVAGQAFTTGVIPLRSFERTAMPTAMRPGVGCDASKLSPDKRASTELSDDGEHELATCYNVRGLGLVVVSSCSHRGVLNAVMQAQAISGVRKVHAVVGGFHLVRPRTEAEARRTAAAMQDLDPTYIIPMHCTGEVFIAEAERLMPQKVIRPYVGNRLVFQA
jgi:7,8-dihydropterin-6-yl-methyl-4-(beta-D-ribofuranosyl)aminobenzene 5'-phosphate synthase